MGYCTQADIINDITEQTLISITDDSAKPAEVNDTLVTDRINSISAVIDTYLYGRYELPFNTAYAILKEICISLVVSDLFERRLQEYNPERVKRAWQALKDIRDGKLQLPINANEVQSIVAYTESESVYATL